MKKWLVDDRETRQPGGEFESTARSVKSKDHECCRSIFQQSLQHDSRVGGSQGRSAPSIEYRDLQKVKETCVKFFVEKYDVVTAPSGEGQAVRKEMTVEVEFQ